MYDIAIIGAGVVGALAARELSRYDLRIVLVDRLNDVGAGTTRANSAIVHAGFDAPPGSLKAKYNVAGTAAMPALCELLHVPYQNTGSVVLAFDEADRKTLDELKARGEQNGVPGLEILEGEALFAKEPNVNPDCTGALWAPSAGIVCPYELAIAGAECAASNGVEFVREFAVKAIDFTGEQFTLNAADGRQVQAKTVINAAGVHADEIARMIGDESFGITPVKGEYLLLDKTQQGIVNTVVFQCPSPMGKGILVSPTVHGNVLVGPNAQTIDDRLSLTTTAAALQEVQEAAKRSLPGYQVRDTITSFAGLRARCDRHDFVIEASAVNPRFIHAGGIESPGLSAAPAIAAALAELAKGDAVAKQDWNPSRAKPVRVHELTTDEYAALVSEQPAYGRIICRCETISEGEILHAIHSPAGARDVDGIKRRTRSGMGRCQGGFCGTKLLEIIAHELDMPMESVTKSGGNSQVLLGRTK
ncbi:MAG: NAD(P)/FAD-dependent oxidoreductase [Oscillospiraceae bacterium]|nr:NAD(P)/FAD-dependent oxidoreductase [Oscillospiraceae bacterium]